MSVTASVPWVDANQRYLSAAIAVVRETIVRAIGDSKDAAALAAANDEFTVAAAAMPSAPALRRIVEAFGLSSFERDALVLCAAVELDSRTATLVTRARGGEVATGPTFGLALSSLREAHWSAITPAAPLRAWHLLELGGNSLTQSSLRIDERVLHFLTGIDDPDDRVARFTYHATPGTGSLSNGEEHGAQQLMNAWQRAGTYQAASLEAPNHAALIHVAARAAAQLGVRLAVVRPSAISGNDEAEIVRLFAREGCLAGSALAIDCTIIEANDHQQCDFVQNALDAVPRVVLLGRLHPVEAQRTVVIIDVPHTDGQEQRRWWSTALAEQLVSPGTIDALTSTFELSRSAVTTAANSAILNARAGDLSKELWRACRSSARTQMQNLAQRIESSVTWDDLVLPAQQKEVLRRVVLFVRHRRRVYHDWGFAAHGKRGLGLAALFAGPSGVGKTMASEVLANELGLDLYRIDLSQIVNKYIGETEKNLRHVFTAAEAGGAILHFDEAEALFGKRSEVRDSHDRYANIEVGYLLQQMESFRGLAILATNMKSALDQAFVRRLRFVVTFPFPDAAIRAEIWRRVFPETAPTEGLDYALLSTLSVTGANIRNIAIDAAISAADGDTPVRMAHVFDAIRREFEKNEQPLGPIGSR